jgi:MoaA/NifB/PqqE/SkfB family radical SAM enzyme
MRGAGSFEKAIEGAVLARRHGIPTELRCVLGKHNIDAIDELIDFVEQLDNGMTVMFQPLRNSLFLGNDRDGSAFMLDNYGIGRALKKLEERKTVSKRVANKWGSLVHFRGFPNDTAIPCAAGWVKATLDPEGYLFHCAMVSRRNKKINVIDRGAARAFCEIARRGCAQCWCARSVEGNLAWGGQLIKLYRKPKTRDRYR